jgi:hypothetical protein
MSVKLLHSDARRLVEIRYRACLEGVGKAQELREMIRHDPSGLSRAPQDFEKNFSLAKQARDGYRDWLALSTVWSESETRPFVINRPTEGEDDLFQRKVVGVVFLYQNRFYAVSGPYSEEEAGLVLVDNLRKKRRKVEYLVARSDAPESDAGYERQPILEEVRHEVWRRDRGRCVQCSSVHNLEFDHVIPVTRGGSSTARNIQLLCEACNRRKSNNIG